MNKPDTTVDELIAQGEKRAELLRQETYTNAASIMYDLCAALQSLQGELALLRTQLHGMQDGAILRDTWAKAGRLEKELSDLKHDLSRMSKRETGLLKELDEAVEVMDGVKKKAATICNLAEWDENDLTDAADLAEEIYDLSKAFLKKIGEKE